MRALLVMLTCVSAVAADLRAPYYFEATGVLPQGVGNPRYLTFFMSHERAFTDKGPSEPLGNRLGRAVTWNAFLAGQAPAQRALFQGILQRANIPVDGLAGSTTGLLSASVQAHLPTLAYGITNDLVAAVVVPVVRVNVNVSSDFEYSEGGKRFIGALCQAAPDKCNAVRAGFSGLTNTKLQAMGYEPLASHTVTGIGDIQLLGKYRWIHTPTDILTSKLTLAIPTGTSVNPNRAVDVTTGENRWRLGLILAYQRRLMEGPARLHLYGGYTALLPNSMVKRLPASPDEPLSPHKLEVSRKWGTRLLGGSTLDYGISSLGLTLSGGYQYQFQSEARYSTGSTDAQTQTRVSWLGALEPSETLHSAIVGATFSTVDWYRTQKFPLPMELNVLYSKPVAGRNAPSGAAVSAELAAFF